MVTHSKEEIGLGNVENKSSQTIRGELTSDNVIKALGYTPPKENTTYAVMKGATASAAGTSGLVLHDSAGYGLRSGNRNRLYNCHGADGRPAGKDGVQRYPGVIQRNADCSSYGYADVNGIYGIFRNDLGGMKR